MGGDGLLANGSESHGIQRPIVFTNGAPFSPESRLSSFRFGDLRKKPRIAPGPREKDSLMPISIASSAQEACIPGRAPTAGRSRMSRDTHLMSVSSVYVGCLSQVGTLGCVCCCPAKHCWFALVYLGARCAHWAWRLVATSDVGIYRMLVSRGYIGRFFCWRMENSSGYIGCFFG